MVQEYLRVLEYPKFQLELQEIQEIWESEILPYLAPVTVKNTPSVIKADPSDDHFLACAKTGRADYLVSGDKHLLVLNVYDQTKIVPLKAFLELI